MFKKILLPLCLIVSLSLSACAPVAVAPLADGVVDGIQEGTNIWAINGALKVLPATIRMYKPGTDFWMFARFNEGGQLWAYTFQNVAKPVEVITQDIAMGGNCTNCRTFSDLLNAMVNNGWRFTQNPVLPEGFWTALVSAMAARASWVSIIATTLPGSMDIPGTILPTPDIE